MKPALGLFGAYLRQREEMGEGPLVLPDSGTFDRQEMRDSERGQRPEPTKPAQGLRAVRPTPVPEARTPPEQPPRRKEHEGWRSGAPPIPPGGISVPRPGSDLFTGDDLGALGLADLAERISTCTRCALCRARTNAVPGQGPDDARLVVVGEGPGATEDETGLPFVGRAGELLTEILAAIEYPRERVFICNVVKCRPPNNRRPQPEEIKECVPYLYRQIDVIQPAVILAMGGTAAETLLGVKQSLGALRSRVHDFRGIPLVATYHPAALLRNPHWKKPTWDDVRIARRLLAGER